MGDEGQWVVMLAAVIFLSRSFCLIALFWFGWRMTQRSHSVSPYTGIPLRRTTEISYYSAERILKYLYDLHQYDNRIFKSNRLLFAGKRGGFFKIASPGMMSSASIGISCRNGIPATMSPGEAYQETQDAIREAHASIWMDFRQRNPPPLLSAHDRTGICLYKTGPLYVDPETKVLLGWKKSPEPNSKS